MGKRGPSKTPVATLKARGTFRKDRHNDEVDSQLPPSLPDPPEHFTEELKAIWNAVGAKLAARGLMTDLDAQAFELLVGSYVGMRQAQDQLSDSDLILYVGELSTPVANPLVNIIGKNAAMLKWCLTQFGCTPSSRTGINPAKRPEAKVDPMAALIGSLSKPKPKAKGKK